MLRNLSDQDLTSLIADLEAASSEGARTTREEFVVLFNRAVDSLELIMYDLACMMKASIPTISRWKSGTSAPHHLGRPSVFLALLKQAKKVQAIRGMEASSCVVTDLDDRLREAIDRAERGETLPRPDKSRREYFEDQSSDE